MDARMRPSATLKLEILTDITKATLDELNASPPSCLRQQSYFGWRIAHRLRNDHPHDIQIKQTLPIQLQQHAITSGNLLLKRCRC